MGSRRPLFTTTKEAAEYHVALLGQLGVGKSALTVKYITRRFIMEYDPTLEDTYSKTDAVDGQPVIVKIMDTYDTEDTNPDRYLKWVHGLLVVYSITSRSSFDLARRYLESITQYQRLTAKDISLGLVGNKMDLERYRTVSKTTGEQLAAEYECAFYETSAADDMDSVERVFRGILSDVCRSNDHQRTLQPLYISEDSKQTLLQPQNATIAGRNSFRRTKSPKISDHRDGKSKDDKDGKEARGTLSRPTFKLFNKNFKIFN